jgi:citrate synthase
MADKPYDVHQLAGSATFGEIACLLPRGRPPAAGGLAGYAGGTGASRAPGPPVTGRR